MDVEFAAKLIGFLVVVTGVLQVSKWFLTELAEFWRWLKTWRAAL